jgi:5-methylcytosine-specific restriction endonuclease McrA
MSPHRITDWFDAICSVYTGKADVLEEYEETVSSVSATFNIPAVIRLKRAVSPHKKAVKFSRINIFTRDGFSCQYCGAKKPMKELNYDHVIPRDQGGKTVWENIVAACYPCNGRKANKTPEQAKMKLLKRPVHPKSLPMTQPIFSLADVPEEWKPYIEAASLSQTA